jgi:hypothetical protein
VAVGGATLSGIIAVVADICLAFTGVGVIGAAIVGGTYLKVKSDWTHE